MWQSPAFPITTHPTQPTISPAPPLLDHSLNLGMVKISVLSNWQVCCAPRSRLPPVIYTFRALSGRNMTGRLHNSFNLDRNHRPLNYPNSGLQFRPLTRRHTPHNPPGRKVWGRILSELGSSPPVPPLPLPSHTHKGAHTLRCTQPGYLIPVPLSLPPLLPLLTFSAGGG